MADDITLPGTGGIVATDEVSSKHYQRIKIAVGADGTATDMVTTKASSNFNRPANTTAYTVNDALNNNATAGSVTLMTFTVAAAAGTVTRVRIRKSDQTVATPTLRLWFYDTTFTPGAGDNAAFAHPAQDSLGYVDVDVVNAGSDDAVGYASCNIPFTGGTLYAQLQTLSAFTPASGETFTTAIWYLPG